MVNHTYQKKMNPTKYFNKINELQLSSTFKGASEYCLRTSILQRK